MKSLTHYRRCAPRGGSGHQLRATDLDWQHGTGELVEASAADLILFLAGRPRPGTDLHD